MGQQKKGTTKARQIRLSHNAIKNIDEITGYVALIKKEPLNAIYIGDAIFETIKRISANPLAFRECEQLATKSKIYRRAACLSWSIIYKVSETEIIILGIIHQSRQSVHISVLRKVK